MAAAHKSQDFCDVSTANQTTNQQPRPRDSRNARRLREFLGRKNPNQSGNWADEFDNSHIVTKCSDPKQKKKPAPPKQNNRSDLPDPVDFRSKKETPAKDEPLYDIGGCTASSPLTERFCQNIDLSGFIPLLVQTYESIKTIDFRLERQMPFAMFQHHCCVYLNTVIWDRLRDQGGRPVVTGEQAIDYLTIGGTEYLIPEVIQEYARIIGKYTTPTGSEVYLNVPDITIPGQGTHLYEPGFFGVCDQHTHNVYECYVSPAVTARCVIATRDNDEEWQPLPDELAPPESVATTNLLGYGPLQPLTAEGRSRLAGINFPETNDLEGRLRISQELSARVNTYLRSIKDKFKAPNISTKTSQRSGAINMLFVETNMNVRDGPELPPLASFGVTIYASGIFGAQTANHALLPLVSP